MKALNIRSLKPILWASLNNDQAVSENTQSTIEHAGASDKFWFEKKPRSISTL